MCCCFNDRNVDQMILKEVGVKSTMRRIGWAWAIALGMIISIYAGSAIADPVPVAAAPEVVAAPGISVEMFTVNNVWMMVSIFLVFIMHLGFATVETGLTRAKNATNILFKNTLIPALGLLTYAFIGFNLMYPGDSWILGKWFGFAGFGIGTNAEGITSAYNVGYTYWTDFLFQGMFAATAATIVSGAVCERIKLSSFLIFATIYVALIYPWVGSWKWGGGWLNEMGFHDFAGSTLVHSVGGWGALAGSLLLGPRIGKYVGGKVKPIMGHNLPLVTIGVFLLWLGWFGFNGGSVLSADPGLVSFVLVTTSLAAAAGIVSSMIVSWKVQKKPDLTMVLNGCLAGLVAVTAGADVVSVPEAILIGLIAGALVVVSVIFVDKLKIDDPVGAISVHLVCGVFGTLAAGIWGTDKSFVTQLIGVVSYGVVCFSASLLIFGVIKAVMGLRVKEEEELRGLDISEHGIEAYSGFQIFTNQ
jgi:Amt family ammonium transporter